MWRIETRRELSPAEVDAVHELLDEAAIDDGFYPLSDQLRLDFVAGGVPGFSALLAVDEMQRIGAYAQLATANRSTTVEVVIAPGERRHTAELAPRLLRAAGEVVAAGGGGELHWWVQRPDDGVESIAAEAGMRPGRQLAQMRRALPLGQSSTVETRAFVVGHDEAEWLRVNNAAFHDHPEQGGWTLATLRQREAEPWFDPAGFRLHERDGRLAAFCWTKVHSGVTPNLGEIYVIAVDPQFHGRGLGRALTIAGLDHLAERGLTVAMLYVDAANVGAMSLYARLGFETHHVDHAYVADIARGSDEHQTTMTGSAT